MTTSDFYVQKDNKYLFHTYKRYPIVIVKGEGQFVWDVDGKKYLDFMSGIACTSLGHNHSALMSAIKEQVSNIWHTSNLFYSPPSIELAQLLVESGGLDKIFFCNSGTEANECAIKLARKYHWNLNLKNKNVILSVEHGFHGRTFASLAATAKPKIQEGFFPLPLGFKYENWNNIQKFCDAIDQHVAAVIIEPIQGEGGIYKPPTGFLETVRKACDKVGALLIFDEVQCGIGRTGELFAYQYYKVKPDIITLAKGLAGGLPLGAVCAKEEIALAFLPGDHGTTFGGNPVACAAAKANILTLLEKDFLTEIKKISKYLHIKINLLQNHFPKIIKEIRGVGLMIGIEFYENCNPILKNCHDLGVLLNTAGDFTIRLLPPFIINEKDIAFFIDALKKAIEKYIFDTAQFNLSN